MTAQGPDSRPARRRTVLDVVTVVLLVVWLLWPWLAFVGVITTAAFFGEQPSAAEERRGTLYMSAALVCAFLAPLLALLTAGPRKPLRVVAVIELVLVPVGVGAAYAAAVLQ